MQVPDGWYVIAASDELKDQTLAITRFGTDFVLWRDQEGKPVLMSDSCPHRSAKLSLGRLKDGCIQCPFHGFEFNDKGQCTFIPETGSGAPNLSVKTLPVVESHGFLWTYRGISDEIDPPWFRELDSSLSMAQRAHQWPAHITRCIENQLDYAHLPFVHDSTIGHGLDVRGTRKVDLSEFGISIFIDPKKPEIATIQYLYPALWLLTIDPGRFYQFISFVPVSDQCTRLYLRAYQKFCTWPLLSQVIKPVLNLTNSIILGQDKRVVLSQKPDKSTEAKDEKLFPSDTAISHFRKFWINSARD